MTESYLPMLLFFGLLTAFMLFALWMGYKNVGVDWIEDEGEESQTPVARASPSLFAPLAAPTNGKSAEVMVNRLEERLRAESRVVARFVERPTVEHLHENTNPVVDQLVRDLEAYLFDASAAASSFAASPSVDELHGVPVPVPASRRRRS